MMSRTALVLLAVLAAAVPGGRGDDKGDKPTLHLRATPRFTFSPAQVLFTAELKGGDDVEQLYCPEVEWEWGDGGKSVQESDCDPWQDGTAIDRRFTERHLYPRAGQYRVRVTLSKSGKKVLSQTVEVTVRAGLGDPTMEY